jgi:hypothetical protein
MIGLREREKQSERAEVGGLSCEFERKGDGDGSASQRRCGHVKGMRSHARQTRGGKGDLNAL